VTTAPPALAVTFDFGQTLAELDTSMLSRRLAERGIEVAAARLEACVPEAWSAYDAAIHAGGGGHPWKVLMARLIALAGVHDASAGGAVDWLWTEQPARNLWRRPIAGMIEIAWSLRRAGVPVGVVSNSEGRLAELIAELGWQDALPLCADSGKLGMEKPESPIFLWAAERLGVAPAQIVHVGDSWAADVEGAVRAGMRAVWFRGRSAREMPPEVRRAEDAEGVRAALGAWGVALADAG
jgi:FMN hydrolase / 5-amino-6-(5-phospho-D-ribitylamino)uracil phosphatase